MVSLPFLSFHVGELLGHLAVAHADDVDAPHVTAPVVPVKHPAHEPAVAGGEALLRLEARRGRGLKERPPERAHRARALEPLAVRRRQGVLEHAIGRHQRHPRGDIVAIERLVEPANDGRAWPWSRRRAWRPLPVDCARFGVPSPAAMATTPENPKDASAITRELNRAVLDALPFADTRDFDDARRGFVGSLPEVEIKNDAGRVV